jgi:hypothetical protein
MGGIPVADTVEGVQNIRRLQARSAIYRLLVAYFAIVCLNSFSVVLLIWLQAVGVTHLEDKILGALALGPLGLDRILIAGREQVRRSLFPAAQAEMLGNLIA